MRGIGRVAKVALLAEALPLFGYGLAGLGLSHGRRPN